MKFPKTLTAAVVLAASVNIAQAAETQMPESAVAADRC